MDVIGGLMEKLTNVKGVVVFSWDVEEIGDICFAVS